MESRVDQKLAIVKRFEKEFDCKVTLDVYEEAETMLAKIENGGASLYDVVVPPDHLVPAMLKLKLLSPLRHENIPNLKNLDEMFANPPYDRGNKYTVAYQWGTVGVYWRKAKVGEMHGQQWMRRTIATIWRKPR